jgi:hypothetical protein
MSQFSEIIFRYYVLMIVTPSHYYYLKIFTTCATICCHYNSFQCHAHVQIIGCIRTINFEYGR